MVQIPRLDDRNLNRALVRAPVDYQQTRFDRRAVLGVGARRKGQSGDETALGAQRPHGRLVLEEARRHDRRETSAIGEAG